MTGLITGLLSAGISKAISGKGLGDGLYLHKNSKCYSVEKTEGDGLFLSPSYSIPNRGDGLFLKQGKNVTDGSGLILGKNNPFRKKSVQEYCRFGMVIVICI